LISGIDISTGVTHTLHGLLSLYPAAVTEADAAGSGDVEIVPFVTSGSGYRHIRRCKVAG
jgi:hypothetical protein